MQSFLSHVMESPGASLLSPADLVGRMEERFASALGRGHAVAALACEPIGLDRVAPGDAEAGPRALGALVQALGPAFQSAEVVAGLEAGHLLVLLVGPSPELVDASCREWVRAAKELRVEGCAAPLHIGLRIGYGVSQPGQRLFLDTLLQVAREGLGIARCRGIGACVHTRLYELLQKRLEHERGMQGIAVTANAPLHTAAPAREVRTTSPARHVVPETAASQRGAARAAQSRSGHEDATRERHVVVPVPPSTATSRETVLMERELAEALDVQRRENDALRERLRALEGRGLSADGHDRIDLLERRLAKLTRSLEEAEDRLAHASFGVGADAGIASRYPTVQGLDPDATHRAIKVTLMKAIFDANLELREHLRGLCRNAPSSPV
jgi:hypothetical protein